VTTPSEEQPSEHRPKTTQRGPGNIFWEVPGTIENARTSGPEVSAVPRSSEEVHYLDGPFEDTVDERITPEELRTSGIPDGRYVALAPGQDLKVTANLAFHESHRQAIYVGRGELVVQDHVHGRHTRHFRLPNDPKSGRDAPVVTKVFVANISREAIGWKSLGIHLILFLDGGNQVVTRLDSSVEYGHNSDNRWEFHLGALQQLCAAAGIAYESESFGTPRQFLDKWPEWAPPKLEFEVDHLPEERVREWGLAIALGLAMACGLFAAAGGALLLVGPVGWVTVTLEAVGTFVAVVLTIWSHSRWRMKRSLHRLHLGTR
jgi:hypothetical protein